MCVLGSFYFQTRAQQGRDNGPWNPLRVTTLSATRGHLAKQTFFFADLKIAPECGTQKIFSWNLIVLAYSIDNVRSPKKSAVDVQNVIVLAQGMSL